MGSKKKKSSFVSDSECEARYMITVDPETQLENIHEEAQVVTSLEDPRGFFTTTKTDSEPLVIL